MDIFFDSSVLLAFCRSKKGASALLIDYCIQGKIKGYVSKKVVFEVQNNNRKDNNEQGKLRFDYILEHTILIIMEDTSTEEVDKANSAFHNSKDAPIIASAKNVSQITHIISFDNGFFKEDVISYVKPKEILKPGEFIQRFRTKLGK